MKYMNTAGSTCIIIFSKTSRLSWQCYSHECSRSTNEEVDIHKVSRVKVQNWQVLSLILLSKTSPVTNAKVKVQGDKLQPLIGEIEQTYGKESEYMKVNYDLPKRQTISTPNDQQTTCNFCTAIKLTNTPVTCCQGCFCKVYLLHMILQSKKNES